MKIFTEFVEKAKAAWYQKDLTKAAYKLVNHIEEEDLRNNLLLRLGDSEGRNELLEKQAKKYELAVVEAVEEYNKLTSKVKITIDCRESYDNRTNSNDIRLRLMYGEYDLYLKYYTEAANLTTMAALREKTFTHCHKTVMLHGIVSLVTKHQKIRKDIALRKKEEEILKAGEIARAKLDENIQNTRQRNIAREKEFIAQQRLAVLTGAQQVKVETPVNTATIFLLNSKEEDKSREQAKIRSKRQLMSVEEYNSIKNQNEINKFRDELRMWLERGLMGPTPTKPTTMSAETYRTTIINANNIYNTRVRDRVRRNGALNSRYYDY